MKIMKQNKKISVKGNEIHKRKFLHHENSFEIFIKNGTSYFIAVNEFNRDKVISNIIRNITTYFPLRKHMLYSKSSVCNINYPDITFSSNDIKKNTMSDLRIGYVPQHLNIPKNTPTSVYDLFASYISKIPVFLWKSKRVRKFILIAGN